MRALDRDAIVAAVIVLLAALAAWQSSLLPFGTLRAPGPGFFPFWASALIGGLAALLLARALTETGARAETLAPAERAERAGGTELPATPAAARSGVPGLAKVALLVVVLALYTAALDWLGYVLCTFLLVVFMLRVLEPRPWPTALGMAVGTALGSYVLFATWLRVPLPPGLLPF